MDPTTDDEWQDAVDAAAAALAIRDAHEYLFESPSTAAHLRLCRKVVEAGRDRGIAANPEVVKRAVEKCSF